MANSGPDDPAYDVVHTGNGRSRIFRGSRLIVLRDRVLTVNDLDALKGAALFNPDYLHYVARE